LGVCGDFFRKKIKNFDSNRIFVLQFWTFNDFLKIGAW
jgi:hypothetical protein